MSRERRWLLQLCQPAKSCSGKLAWFSHSEKFLTRRNRPQAGPSSHTSGLFSKLLLCYFHERGADGVPLTPTGADHSCDLCVAWQRGAGRGAALSSVLRALHDPGGGGKSLHHSPLFPSCPTSHLSFKHRSQPASAVLP